MVQLEKVVASSLRAKCFVFPQVLRSIVNVKSIQINAVIMDGDRATWMVSG